MESQQRLKDLGEIAIVIDSWDDVFSDFDPRPLNERTVSGDFVDELRKRYRETRTGDFVITIIAPFALKDKKAERMVTVRLKRHFLYRFLQHKKDLAVRRIRGVVFVCVGISSLTFLTLATYFKFMTELAVEIAGIVLMPLGWFGFWEGLSKLVDTSPSLARERDFFRKLSNASYRFRYIDGKEHS